MDTGAFFAIYIHEADDGAITVKSDHVGFGLNAFELGLYVMQDLKSIEANNPGHMTVEHCQYLTQVQ